MVLFRPDDYASFSQDLAWELLAAISIEEPKFLDLARTCFGACHEAKAGAAGEGKRCSECGGGAADIVATAAGPRRSVELAVADS
jgi:hypothetical protein